MGMHIYCAGARTDALSALLDGSLASPRPSIVLHDARKCRNGVRQSSARGVSIRGAFSPAFDYSALAHCAVDTADSAHALVL